MNKNDEGLHCCNVQSGKGEENEHKQQQQQQQEEKHDIRIPNTNHIFTIKKRYTNLQLIGRGAYGLVAAAYDTLHQRQVAIKKVTIFPDDDYNDHDDDDDRDDRDDHDEEKDHNNTKNRNVSRHNSNIKAKRLLREIKILRHFRGHNNIVQIYDVMIDCEYKTNKNKSSAGRTAKGNASNKKCKSTCLTSVDTDQTNTNGNCNTTITSRRICAQKRQRRFSTVYIVLNLMESDLDQIIASPQQLSEKHVKYFLHQILRSIEYMHSANVLHRDLKPSNLLVNSNCDVCLCDFGLARGIHSSSPATNCDDGGDPQAMTEYVVTRWYRAPELLCESNQYGKPADIWALGCIFVELCTRKPFIQGKTPLNQIEMIIEILGCLPEQNDRSSNNGGNVNDDASYIEKECTFLKHSPQIARDVVNHARLKARPWNRGLRRHLPNIDPDAFDLISKFLVLDPEKRISAKAALAHRYFKDFHNTKWNKTQCPPFNDDFERDNGRSAQEIRAMISDEEQFFCKSSVSN